MTTTSFTALPRLPVPFVTSTTALPTARKVADVAALSFSRHDSSSNGQIDLASGEGASSCLAKANADGNGVVTRTEAAAYVASFDTDGDGLLSFREQISLAFSGITLVKVPWIAKTSPTFTRA